MTLYEALIKSVIILIIAFAIWLFIRGTYGAPTVWQVVGLWLGLLALIAVMILGSLGVFGAQ